MSGCQSTSENSNFSRRTSDQTPQELLHAAAVASISLAAKLRLQAAEQYLERHEFDLAEAALRAISRDNLTPADLTRFNQARAQILIDAGNFLEAKTLLTQQVLASALDYHLTPVGLRCVHQTGGGRCIRCGRRRAGRVHSPVLRRRPRLGDDADVQESVL